MSEPKFGTDQEEVTDLISCLASKQRPFLPAWSKLGEGSWGRVYRVTPKCNAADAAKKKCEPPMAVKVQLLTDENTKLIQDEINLQRTLLETVGPTQIAELKDAKQCKRRMYTEVKQYKGDMVKLGLAQYAYLYTRHSELLPKSDTSIAITNAQLLAMFQLADDFQTKRKLLHMDLKPENLLYDAERLFTLYELVLNDFTYTGSMSKDVRQVPHMDLFTGKQTFHITRPSSEGFTNNSGNKCDVLVTIVAQALNMAIDDELAELESKAQIKRTEKQLEEYKTKLLEEYVKIEQTKVAPTPVHVRIQERTDKYAETLLKGYNVWQLEFYLRDLVSTLIVEGEWTGGQWVTTPSSWWLFDFAPPWLLSPTQRIYFEENCAMDDRDARRGTSRLKPSNYWIQYRDSESKKSEP